MAGAKGIAGNVLGGAGTGLAVGGPIGAAIGGIGGGLLSLFGDDENAAMEELLKRRTQYLGGAKPQQLQWEMFDPEAYKYQTIEDSPELIAAQKDYLNRLQGLGETGLSEEDAAALDRAQSEASRKARGDREAILTNAAARGVGGGGLEFAMGQQATQDAYENSRRAAFEKAAQTARQRALYQTAYGDALSGVRQQNFGNNSANTDIINRYNQANTETRNQAQMYNQMGRQNTMQTNNQNRLNWGSAMAGDAGQQANWQAAKTSADNASLWGGIGALSKAYLGNQSINQQDRQMDQQQQYLDLLKKKQMGG